ncbi:MAG: MoaD/ThiS family protein [Chloroflexi bacterium]|nr:MoaD/ThiS family protein [Chloroflexota bacterium]
MVISIEFLGPQRSATNRDGIEMPITETTTVKDVLDYVRRRYPDLGLDDTTAIITVNQQVAGPGRILKPGETVCFLPLVGGGE